MTNDFQFPEYVAPAIVFPGQAGHESAYQTAFDLLSRRFPKEALDLIEPALAEEPKNVGLRTLRAWAFLQRAQLVRAADELRSLVAENPCDVWAQHALGRALERQSKYDEALPHLRLAAVMSDDYDHHAAVFRVQRLMEARAE